MAQGLAATERLALAAAPCSQQPPRGAGPRMQPGGWWQGQGPPLCTNGTGGGVSRAACGAGSVPRQVDRHPQAGSFRRPGVTKLCLHGWAGDGEELTPPQHAGQTHLPDARQASGFGRQNNSRMRSAMWLPTCFSAIEKPATRDVIWLHKAASAFGSELAKRMHPAQSRAACLCSPPSPVCRSETNPPFLHPHEAIHLQQERRWHV